MEKNQRKTYGGRKMKTIIKASWILTVGLALAMLVSNVATGGEKSAPDSSGMEMQEQKAPADVRSNSQGEQQRDSQDKSKEKGLTKPVNMPIYRPPLRGAPAGRVAGGTRGPNEKFPYLCLLVPEHVGLTTNAQPSLYYFVSHSTSCPVEFVLLEKRAVYPLIETRASSLRNNPVCMQYTCQTTVLDSKRVSSTGGLPPWFPTPSTGPGTSWPPVPSSSLTCRTGLEQNCRGRVKGRRHPSMRRPGSGMSLWLLFLPLSRKNRRTANSGSSARLCWIRSGWRGRPSTTPTEVKRVESQSLNPLPRKRP